MEGNGDRGAEVELVGLDVTPPWLVTRRTNRQRYYWNIRLNGRNLEYAAGLQAPVQAGDEVSFFPPGR